MTPQNQLIDITESPKYHELVARLNIIAGQMKANKSEFDFYKKSVDGEFSRINTELTQFKEKLNNTSISLTSLTSRLNNEKIDIKLDDDMLTTVRTKIASFVNEHVKRYDILILDLKKDIENVITKLPTIQPIAQLNELVMIKDKVDNLDMTIGIIGKQLDKTNNNLIEIKNEYKEDKSIVNSMKNAIDEIGQLSIEVANMSSPMKIASSDDLCTIVRGLEGRIALIEKSRCHVQPQQSVQYCPVGRRAVH
jgi:DNA repair ATPase RecN